MKSLDGPLGKVKAVVGKATEAVANLVRKDDDKPAADGADGAATDLDPSERSQRMKDAVDNARKAQSED